MNEQKNDFLETIAAKEEILTTRFQEALLVNHALDRTLVSFQANKNENGSRWCKYKEGFSTRLIKYICEEVGLEKGRILDPFAGSGTTLFVAREQGMDSVGIELLPNSAEIIKARIAAENSDRQELAEQLRAFGGKKKWERDGDSIPFKHLAITKGCFPTETETALERYLYEVEAIQDETTKRALRFAAMSVLEEISYTRKDGQYLRWDSRSGRRVGRKPFSKGHIAEFTDAVTKKLEQIAADIDSGGRLFDKQNATQRPGAIELMVGSCLKILPALEQDSFDGLITSPPYCNRYDYTRTYALELAMLGVDEEHIRELRQALLSCTVENKEKDGLHEHFGKRLFQQAINAFEAQELLALILQYLEYSRIAGNLNNPGIPRMVRNYFKEMAVVIFDSARVLRPGSPFVMVNDNVRYQGAHIPVDLILSDLAERAGFNVETIWVLPRGKGNSSQQMREHGRKELRKCVYVWRLKEKSTKKPNHRAVPGL